MATNFLSFARPVGALALLLAVTAAPVRAQPGDDVEQITLANGLTVIAKPDHRPPTVAQMLWVLSTGSTVRQALPMRWST